MSNTWTDFFFNEKEEKFDTAKKKAYLMELQKLQFSKISARIMVRTTNKPQLGHFSSQLSDNTIKKNTSLPGFYHGGVIMN